MFSTVLIIPANLRAEANMLGEAMGWGPDNYSVPLSGTGQYPATHYGLHAWATQEFVDLMQGVSAGVIPPVSGLTTAQVVEVVSALTTSILPSAEGHWASILANNGLRAIVQDGP